MKDLLSILFIMLLIFSFSYSKMMPKWNFDKGGEDWPKSCKTLNQAPFDLSAPFVFKANNRTFLYSKMMTEYSFYNNGNNLILEGDFGYILYNNVTFFSSEINFYSPSMHSIGLKKMPMEMQIIHHDNYGNKVSISILFKYSKDYSLFLATLGFDHTSLRFMKPFQPRIIKGNIDISKFIGDEKDFFYYESVENNPPCTSNTTYLILTDVLKVSKEQLDNFPKIIKNKSRNIQLRRNRPIFTTFPLSLVKKKNDEVLSNIDKLKKKREENEKFKLLKLKIQKKTLPKKNKLTKLKIKELKRLNMTINKTIVKALNKYNKNNTLNKTDNCTKLIPIDNVKQRIKAMEKYKQVTQVSIINSGGQNKTDTLVIDYEFPKSDAEIKRLSIDEKEKLLSELYSKSKLDPKNAAVLIQIDKLERDIKNDLINSMPEDKYFSFLVMDNQLFEENSILEKESKIENSITNYEMMKDVMNININDQFESNDKLAAKGRQRQMENERLFEKINQASKNINEKTKESKVISKPTISAAKEDDTSLSAIRKKEEEQNKGIDEVLKKLKEERETDKNKKESLLGNANSFVKEMRNYGNKNIQNSFEDKSTLSTSVDNPQANNSRKHKEKIKRNKRRLIEKEMNDKAKPNPFFRLDKENSVITFPKEINIVNNPPVNTEKKKSENINIKNTGNNEVEQIHVNKYIENLKKQFKLHEKPIITKNDLKGKVDTKKIDNLIINRTIAKEVKVNLNTNVKKNEINVSNDIKTKEVKPKITTNDKIKNYDFLKDIKNKAKDVTHKLNAKIEGKNNKFTGNTIKKAKEDKNETFVKKDEYLKNTMNKAKDLREKFRKLSEKVSKVDQKNNLQVNKKPTNKISKSESKIPIISKTLVKQKNITKKEVLKKGITKNTFNPKVMTHKEKLVKNLKKSEKSDNPRKTVLNNQIKSTKGNNSQTKEEEISSTFSSLKKRFERVSEQNEENLAQHTSNTVIQQPIIKKIEVVKKSINKPEENINVDPAKALSTIKNHIKKGKEMSQGMSKKPANDDFSSLREEILKGKKLSQTYNEILNDFLDGNTNKVNKNEVVKLIKKTGIKKEKECHTNMGNKILQSDDPELAKLKALKEKTNELNERINNRKISVKITQEHHNELKESLMKMKKKNNDLMKKVESQKGLIPKDINDSYLTDLDFDKTIFNFLKIVYDNLGKEFAQLDKISQKVYGNENGLLNSEGYIKITKKNFATIVRKAYLINSHQELNYDTKLNQIYDFAYKTLIIQSKRLQSDPLSELRHLSERDVNSLQNKISMKTVDNQLPLNESSSKVKVLVLEILKNLPLILLTVNPNQKTFVATHKGEIKYSVPNSEQVYEASILTAANSNNLRKNKIKTLIIGPNIRNLNQLKAPPGEGRKPVSRDGKIDPTEIFSITNWPSSCKTDKRQSPININRPYQPLSVGIKMKYETPKGNVVFINDGYKLILRGFFGKLFYGVHEYTAVEIHFHHPSEHTFGDDEKRSPLEMQIIHQDIFGNLAGVAVLFNLSVNENMFLKQIGFGVDNPLYAMRLRNSETVELKTTEHLNLGKYLNQISHYVHYVGSITSPPCNDNVQWFVLLEKLGVTQRQLEYFPVLFGMESNVRGLQVNKDRLQEII